MEMLPFDNRDGLIWMNGEFIAWNDAKCHVINQGMHYASSVFEGERAYKGKIFKSEEHTKRLFKSANTLGMDMPFSEKQINEAKDELINKMKLQDCYVRPIVWRGSKQMGLSTSNSDINVAIAAWDRSLLTNPMAFPAFVSISDASRVSFLSKPTKPCTSAQ